MLSEAAATRKSNLPSERLSVELYGILFLSIAYTQFSSAPSTPRSRGCLLIAWFQCVFGKYSRSLSLSFTRQQNIPFGWTLRKGKGARQRMVIVLSYSLFWLPSISSIVDPSQKIMEWFDLATCDLDPLDLDRRPSIKEHTLGANFYIEIKNVREQGAVAGSKQM